MKLRLGDVRTGRCVLYCGRWGVTCGSRNKNKRRVIDFWDGGREHVPARAVVSVLDRRADSEYVA